MIEIKKLLVDFIANVLFVNFQRICIVTNLFYFVKYSRFVNRKEYITNEGTRLFKSLRVLSNGETLGILKFRGTFLRGRS